MGPLGVHPSFLEILHCPATREPLRLVTTTSVDADGCVVEGTLATASGLEYPITRRVPRLTRTSTGYADSFGVEWGRWRRTQFEEENVGRPMAGHTTRMWDAVTGRGSERLDGQVVVEFGCGPGRFLDVVRRRGGRAVGLELSAAADVAAANFAGDPDVLVVQGDILAPPFAPGVFDGGYSIGVLHHTPDPRLGLHGLADAVRDGGWVACSVYGKGEFYDLASVERFRRLHQRLHGTVGYRFADAYSALSASVLSPLLTRARALPFLRGPIDGLTRSWLPILALPDARWSRLDMFDAITPAIATTHTGEELLEWFRAARCPEPEPMSWGSAAAAAVVRR